MQAPPPPRNLARRLLAFLVLSVLGALAHGGEFLLPLANGHRWPTGGVAANSSNENSPSPPPNYYVGSDGWYGGTSNTV